VQENDHWALPILYSLAWLICSFLVVVDALTVRQATLDVLTAVQVRQVEASAENERVRTQLDTGFVIGAVDQGMLFFGGVVAVVLSLAIEYYFRMGQKQGVLLKRIGMVAGIQVAVLIVSLLVQFVV
jgi:hypothetical protein